MNITTKIWLCGLIFVVGFLFSTTLDQVRALNTEAALDATSAALFPAAQQSQAAVAAFQQAVKAFSDAVLVEDAARLDAAAESGRAVTTALRNVGATAGLSTSRAHEATDLSGQVEQFFNDAHGTYKEAVTSPTTMTAEVQAQMRRLAERTDTLTAALKALNDGCSADLHGRLRSVAQESSSQRWLSLAVFVATLVIAGALVHVTISRGITGPILRVADGVKRAAEEAARASDRMAASGQTVAMGAQDQAASLEETSASLEELSAGSRESAVRGREADSQMQAASRIATRATETMAALRKSMDQVATSAKHVAAVLTSIDGIAFQTNILALNAAVEAARAGAAGAGFSVVADEVRSLAHRSADAARNSAEIIDKTIVDVARGVELVGDASKAFGEVLATISTSSKVVADIATGSAQQVHGISQINDAVAQIQRVTQSNTEHAQDTAEAAAEMREQMQTTLRHLDELLEAVGRKSRYADAGGFGLGVREAETGNAA